MKESLRLFNLWKAKLEAARAKANAITAKETVSADHPAEEITQAEHDALKADLAAALDLKARYETALALEAEEAAALDLPVGRRAKNNPAPAILTEGNRGQSKMLRFSNIWKATKATNGTPNFDIFRRECPEELDLSNRLKRAGYHAEYADSFLMPLDASLLVEPVDEEGRKLADFEALRTEVKQRLAPVGIDPGEIAWLLKRHPELAAALGVESKADMLMGDDALGGFLIPEIRAGSIIDLFRAMSVLAKAGAIEVGLPPSGNIAYPRITSDPSFTYTDEDTNTDGSTTQVGTGLVRLQAKSLRGFVGMPNSLLRYSSPSAEQIVRAALAAKAALTSDNAGLEGVGSSIAPKGLITYTPSTAETPTAARLTLHVAQTVATDGNTLEPEDIALIKGLYYSGNDPMAPTAWLCHPMYWAALCNKRADAVSAGDKKGPWIFPVDRGAMGNEPATRLDGVPVYPSTQITRNRSKGASTTLNYLLLGNFNRLIHGMVGVIEIASSEHVKFLQDKTIIRAILRDDFGVEHEESFVFTDTLVQA